MDIVLKSFNQQTNGPVNAHLIFGLSKATKHIKPGKTSKFREFMSHAKIFLRNTESSENVKFIGGFIHTRYILSTYVDRGRTGLVVRALDSGSGDPGSILGWVGVLFP